MSSPSSSSSETLKEFRKGSPLHAYLSKKCPSIISLEKKEYTANQVLRAVVSVIQSEKQIDSSNRAIVMCNPELEMALGVKALHLSEIREFVFRHFVDSSIEPTTGGESTPKPLLSSSSPPPPHSTTAEVTMPTSSSSTAPLLGQCQNFEEVGIVTSTNKQQNGDVRVTDEGPPSTEQLDRSVEGAKSSALATTRAVIMPSSQRQSPSTGWFRLKKEFLEVLKLVPDFDSTKECFRFDEVATYLSTYILHHRQRLFDARNIKVVLVANDPLGKAFGVRAFHRSQVTTLLKNQLIPVEKPKMEDPLPMLSSSPPIIPRLISRKRTISTTEDSDEGAAETKRTNVRSCSSFTIAVLGYESSDEETIYSAQGYETVAMNTDVNSPLNSTDEDDEVYEVEYEIDSDEEVNPKHGSGKTKESTSSSDESKIEDVVMVLQDETDTEVWADADSESNFDNPTLDRELTARGDWKCCMCSKPHTLYLNYCDQCWQARKVWIPERPKGRKKNKKTKGQILKNSVRNNPEALSRSISDPGNRNQDHDELDKGKVLSTGEEEVEESTTQIPENKLITQKFCASSEEAGSTVTTCSSSSSQETLDSGLGSSQESVVTSSKIEDDDDGEGEEAKNNKASTVGGRKGLRKKSISEEDDSELKFPIQRTITMPSTSNPNLLCSFCYLRPKNATLIHGRIGHTICCYQCAKKLWNKQRPCPICRRKIEKFVVNIIA